MTNGATSPFRKENIMQKHTKMGISSGNTTFLEFIPKVYLSLAGNQWKSAPITK